MSVSQWEQVWKCSFTDAIGRAGGPNGRLYDLPDCHATSLQLPVLQSHFKERSLRPSVRPSGERGEEEEEREERLTLSLFDMDLKASLKPEAAARPSDQTLVQNYVLYIYQDNFSGRNAFHSFTGTAN